MTVLVLLFLALGVFLQVVATVGILRLPDVYSRVHTVGIADTAGILAILVAIGLSQGASLTTVKLAFIMIFYLLANPTAAHALGNAALRAGVRPWTRGGDAEGRP